MYFVRKKRIRKISLVPMIDVLLCLLIFFMITSKFIYFNQIELSSNKGSNSTKNSAESDDKSIYLTLINKNNIKYLGIEYTLSSLTQALKENTLSSQTLSERQKIPVIVSIDEKLAIQDFVAVLEILRMENLNNIQLRKVNV